MKVRIICLLVFCLSVILSAGDYSVFGNIFKDVSSCVSSFKRVNDNNRRESRTFSKSVRIKKYNEQQGICAHCGKRCSFSEMEGDHIIPWSKGGSTTEDNLQMLCRHCNRSKGNRYSY